MKIIDDLSLLEFYIEKYGLQEYFTKNLTQIAALHQYDADEMLAHEGQLCEYIWILVKGECMAYVYTANNKIHCECYFKDVSLLGEAATLWNEPPMNNVRTLTECHMVSIFAPQYRETLLNDNKFLRFAAYTLALHVRQNVVHFDPLETRLAGFILDAHKNGVFRYNLTQCADIMETSYRHLMRVLRIMCDSGILIKGERGDYHISDCDHLRQVAKGDIKLKEP
ncbi:cyclic nucleotide-binding domain-containing protein [Oscillospiraceae bacterium MB08-C2-2]|nr:cyclic nucleotide-binding domain-containing protein [Oscillospiraceae bacterium MB08-C2-2]